VSSVSFIPTPACVLLFSLFFTHPSQTLELGREKQKAEKNKNKEIHSILCISLF
jgi:hypothetical protein